MPSQQVTIVNRLGLHARASARFVQTAAGFPCEIKVVRDGTRPDTFSDRRSDISVEERERNADKTDDDECERGLQRYDLDLSTVERVRAVLIRPVGNRFRGPSEERLHLCYQHPHPVCVGDS